MSLLLDTQAKLSDIDGEIVSDANEYRIIASALQYLTYTRPEI
jgi:hypothetical protein